MSIEKRITRRATMFGTIVGALCSVAIMLVSASLQDQTCNPADQTYTDSESVQHEGTVIPTLRWDDVSDADGFRAYWRPRGFESWELARKIDPQEVGYVSDFLCWEDDVRGRRCPGVHTDFYPSKYIHTLPGTSIEICVRAIKYIGDNEYSESVECSNIIEICWPM